MAESSTKPYLIRALYEWCCDNGYTPYLAVVVDRHTLVPRQHVKNGEIVLNVSPMATNHMQMGNELIEFQARFSGVAQQLSIPVDNVAAIYARETGHGMAFEVTRPEPGREADEDAAPRGAEGGSAAEPAVTGAEEAGQAASPAQDIGAAGRAPAAARKRAGKSEGGADVIAFASPAGGRRKGEPTARSGAPGKGRTAVKQPEGGEAEAPAAEATPGADATDPLRGGPAVEPAGDGRQAQPEATERGVNGNAGAPSGHPHPDDRDEPPPSSGGKGTRTRLTRVK